MKKGLKIISSASCTFCGKYSSLDGKTIDYIFDVWQTRYRDYVYETYPSDKASTCIYTCFMCTMELI